MVVVHDTSFSDTHYFDIVIGSYQYLVWNPDLTPSSGLTIDSILSSLGYSGIYTTSLPTDDLGLYQSIFVCAGIFSNNYGIGASSSEAVALVDYVNNGGNIYLEGGDVWYYDPLYSGGYDFGSMFGINAVADGINDLGPVGGLTGTFTETMNFTYSGENNYIDHIQATGTGFNIFEDTNNSYYCGVANDAGSYKTVGTSFELGGLVDATDASTKADLLDSIMTFFGITTSGVEEISELIINTTNFSVHPNPFRQSVEISFVLPANINAELRIFDISGRIIKNFNLSGTAVNEQINVRWNGRDNTGNIIPNGVYFISLKAGSSQFLQKIISVQ